MISLQHVSKSYDAGRTLAVKDLSLQIRSGEIFGLLGPNGAGKSTLLNMLAGVLAPSSGTIELDGIDLSRDPMAAKRNLCYVSDTPDHLLRLRGYEFLAFIADVYGVPEDVRVERIGRLAEEYGMAGELNNQIQSYSHGMRQKMMVMGALLPDPAVWILDEPMTGLDPKAAWLLKRSMRAHADAGKTVLFSTHVLDVAEKVVDRVGVIRAGELIFVGTVDEMREHFHNSGSLEEMFLELTGEDVADGGPGVESGAPGPGVLAPADGPASAESR